VLDFFAGSGTTGQAILELNQEFGRRQFILIEQMDYIHDVTIPRIVKSLDLYNSKDSFIYCEFQQDEKPKVSSKSRTFSTKFYAL
jgi:adenine-specific DNA-methyltransferase